MTQIPHLKCRQTATIAIYDYLVREGYADRLDRGFRVLDYHNPGNPRGILTGSGDGKVDCEELWENGFFILDDLGRNKEAVQRYQQLRRLIETQTKRPVSWVLETPTTDIPPPKQHLLEKKAHQIRQKVQGAIDELNQLLAEVKKQSEEKYQRCLIASLYWFVIVSENGKGEPPQFASFLKAQGIRPDVVDKIRTRFSEYLQKNGGGLGLANAGSDAATETTALETVLQTKGGCTEQSKVMYAVLRMAGMEAFFVEPQLSVEYFLAKNRQPAIPLQSHMASGVGVRIFDETGKEKIWIVDIALHLLEADYLKNTDQWNAHPYWELSLRHFTISELSNLGFDQVNHGKYTAAAQNFKTALQLGKDSTAHHVMGNYAWLLSIKTDWLSCLSRDRRKRCKEMEKDIDRHTKEATEINPHNPATQFSRGQFLLYKDRLGEAIEFFLRAVDADPRYLLPYQKLGDAICMVRQKTPDLFASAMKNLEEKMLGIAAKHPRLKEIIKKGMAEMQKRIAAIKPPDKKLADLIGKLGEKLR